MILPPQRMRIIHAIVTYGFAQPASNENTDEIALFQPTTIPIACTIASTTAKYLVICVSFFLPSSPSLLNLESAGITRVKSCIMMNALMNGKIPRENNVAFCNEPPVIVDRIPKNSLLAIVLCTVAGSSPGTGI